MPPSSSYPFNADGLMAIATPAVTALVLERAGWPMETIIALISAIHFVLVVAIELESSSRDGQS